MKAIKNKYQPASVKPYQYWGRVEHVVDGDTVDLEVALGFELRLKIRARLMGINTPEIFGVKKDSQEYKKGIAAKEHLESLLPDHGWVEAVASQSTAREKYGRWLATLFSEGVNLNDSMVEAGHATRVDA